ncbi:MAG: CmcJ/NvfI family oxidoreductase [Pseudomonadota bacterium]
MTAVALNGFLPQGFEPPGRLRGAVGTPQPLMARDPVEIGDARAFQAGAASEAAFFAEHGFVLLPHPTCVRDWDADIATLYKPEIEAVVRERLFPGRRVEIEQGGPPLRRGRDTPVPFYAEGVHSDGGIGADDYAHNIAAFAGEAAGNWWRAHYERDEVEGVVWVDFWRTTNMAGPLEHMPLALLDITTLDGADCLPTGLTGIAPEGRETHHLALRFNPAQRWYSYSRMTADELLAFKLMAFWKDPQPPQNCFHSAFRHPDAPADAETRQSCEYRVGVVVLRP